MDVELRLADAPPAELRARYLGSLPEPQIHYLEKRVAAGRAVVIGPPDAPLGYAAVHDGAVVEFHTGDALLPQLTEAFHAAAQLAGAACAEIKSFDALALAAAAGRPVNVAAIGVNATSWSDERFDPPAGFSVRLAEASDEPLMLAIGPGLFETPDEVRHHLQAREARIYALDGAAFGCGLVTPVRAGADPVDLGVGVLPAWRGGGLGEQIIRHLKVLCLRELGVRPTCGCAVENVASRRTLESAGFLTRHRVLQLRWDP
jgi:RimJ/RimL family protein N-acetyltransferase